MHIDEVRNNQFYQFPQWLLKEPYNMLSYRAMLMYMLLFDRRSLSVKNKWFDDDGMVYVYFTNEQFMDVLRCGNKAVVSAKKELHEVGLLKEIRQGVQKPNRLYIYGSVKNDLLKCENNTSRSVKTTRQEVSNSHATNTNNINTNISRLSYPDNNNNTNIIYSAFEQEFGRLLSPSQMTMIDEMVEEHSEPLVLEALKETVVRGKFHNYNYLRAILDNWKNDNLTTVEQVRQGQQKRTRNRKSDDGFVYDEQYNFEKWGGENE